MQDSGQLTLHVVDKLNFPRTWMDSVLYQKIVQGLGAT